MPSLASAAKIHILILVSCFFLEIHKKIGQNFLGSGSLIFFFIIYLVWGIWYRVTIFKKEGGGFRVFQELIPSV